MFLHKKSLEFLKKSKDEKLDIALTSVINTSGSTYSKTGSIMLVNSKKEFTGVLGSKFLQNKVIETSHKSIKEKSDIEFESIAKDPTSGHGNSKYLTKSFLYEDDYLGLEKYIKKPYSLLIFGSGAHVSSLIDMANILGWETTIIDIKIQKEFVENADTTIELDTLDDILSMDLSSYNASVILSHNPKTDDTYLKSLIKTSMDYIGLMGNKRNMKIKKEQFKLENDKRFFAPVGLDIGSYSSESIALSICSQIEANKNGKINV